MYGNYRMTSRPQTAAEIRQSYLNFFAEKGHTIVPSAPVVPHDDPTLMFTNAGMNQFKGIFLGDNPKGLKRATDTQKCIRVSGKHNDLEEVGRDTYHHTLFEMLGNWSFGDYYKRETMEYAWELLTEVWGLEKERIFVSVFETDDEAAELWKDVSGLPDDRIMRFDAKDNFWEMGDTGPCGPCSEIHYDKGDLSTQAETFNDPILGVNGENDRYIEIWNLVFIQYNRQQNGDLEPLAEKHIDTGMGFERMCAILQGVHSNYDTDLFQVLIQKIASESQVAYVGDLSGMPHRVIADHLRTVSFAIADGVMPSNDGRGYVIRRILRRASRYARNLGQEKPFLCELVDTLVELMGDAFPELVARREFITNVIRAEEESFIRTLGKGLDRFAKLVEELDDTKTLSGEGVFTLYDTYGFPVDLTRLLAEEQGLQIDEAGFEKAMQEQKTRGRENMKTTINFNTDEGWTILSENKSTAFLGYDQGAAEVQISRYYLEDEMVHIVLNQTPFYAEAGGQVGESGTLELDETVITIIDTTKVNDVVIHKAKVTAGALSSANAAGAWKAQTHSVKRLATRRNHSATHLLHAALKEVLGSHVNQQGSRVAPEGLRFDFSHFQGVTQEELNQIQELVNQQVLANVAVQTNVQDIETAKAEGAMALFGEKYDDEVRVVSMGASDFSKELCGGLHVERTGDIGLIKIISESSVAAGVRRIEALTGPEALSYLNQQEAMVQDLASTLKSKPAKLVSRIAEMQTQSKKLEKEMERMQTLMANAKIDQLLAQAEEFAGTQLIVQTFDNMEKKAFASLIESMSVKHSGIAVLANSDSESGSIAVTVAKDLTSQVKAGNLVKEISAIAGGKGGGRPDKAQAGTKEPNKIPAALEAARGIIEGALAE